MCLVLDSTPLKTRRLALIVAVVVLILDQLIKWWVVATLPGDPIVLIDGILQLRYVANFGAAFSILDGSGSLIALVAIAAVVFILLVVTKVYRIGEVAALGLVLGGAFGNLVDRLRGGAVTDFIDVGWWPIFNLADSSIVIGIGLLLAAVFLGRQPKPDDQHAEHSVGLTSESDGSTEDPRSEFRS